MPLPSIPESTLRQLAEATPPLTYQQMANFLGISRQRVQQLFYKYDIAKIDARSFGTPTKEDVLNFFIADTEKEKGVPPSIYKIGKAFGTGSIMPIRVILETLVEEGLLERFFRAEKRSKPAGYRLVNGDWSYSS